MSKKRMITKSVIFLLILAFILKIFSSLSIAMGYNANPLYNYSSYSIFQEPDNSIDVLSIGDSNVYSSIFPLVWWEQQGFTGYTWGQPSQRIPETYEYLKKINLTKTHVFKYSPRKGTKAADMPNQLDGTVKDERSKALIELNDINEHAFTEKFIGRVMDVLIEKEIKDKPDYYEGYTRNYIKVIVHCMSADITGKIVDIKIEKAEGEYAIGDLLQLNTE